MMAATGQSSLSLSAVNTSTLSAFAWRLSNKIVLQNSPLLGAVCPGAKANGLLTPRQTLRHQVVSHCQATLINSYKSWRDKRWTVTYWRPYKWKCNRLTNTFSKKSTQFSVLFWVFVHILLFKQTFCCFFYHIHFNHLQYQ